MTDSTTAEQHLDLAIAALEVAQDHRSTSASLTASREAAARAYVAVIVLHCGEASVDEPLRHLIERASGFVELDPCAADAFEIEEYGAGSPDDASMDADLLAHSAVTWAKEVFAPSTGRYTMIGSDYLLLDVDDRRRVLLGAIWLAAGSGVAESECNLLALGRQVAVDENTRRHVEASVAAAMRADASVDLFQAVIAAMEARTFPSSIERSEGPNEP